MTRRFGFFFLLACLFGGHLWALGEAAATKKALPHESSAAYVIPGPLLKATSLEFDGLAADILLLKALVVFGGTMERGKNTFVVEDWEWRYMFNLLEAATELDPYFLDPYYFSGTILNLHPPLARDVTHLLEKGSSIRPWDWVLPFFLGWNYFSFFQDSETAAKHLRESYRRNPKNTLVATLAARLSYQGKHTENGIIFLRGILDKTEDEKVRAVYETRLKALEGIYVIERGVSSYRDRFGREPDDVDALLSSGILTKLPEDPYGGTFFLQEDGSVASTSNLVGKKAGGEK